MTGGTSQANAGFRRELGFYYDLVKASVERIVKDLTAALENLPVTAVGVTQAGCARNGCWKTSASPGPAGARPAPKGRVSRSPSRLPMGPQASPRHAEP
jgi:hypothetical protein